jgi:hypothetical protein
MADFCTLMREISRWPVPSRLYSDMADASIRMDVS